MSGKKPHISQKKNNLKALNSIITQALGLYQASFTAMENTKNQKFKI